MTTVGASHHDTSSLAATIWHQTSVEETFERLGSSPAGLSTAEAQQRLIDHGRNELRDGGTKHPLRIVWEQVSAIMVLILIAAAILSLVLGKYLEAIAIGVIVVLFTALGFFQEYRAEQAIAALRRMSAPVVRVIRDGQSVEIDSVEVVPGDVVFIEAGTVIPADLRMIEVANLRVQEAALTGESEPVDKSVDAVEEAEVALGDRRCIAYSGTQVTYGRGVGVVVAAGMATELGTIASLLHGVEDDQTPLQARLDRVGKQLAIVGVAVAAVVVAMGALAGGALSDLVLTAISVAVAVIPEGLPAVVTLTLAIGSQRMLQRNALIRKLPAVETLGSVTVICSDKTGTLTQNRMTVTTIDAVGQRFDLMGAKASQPIDRHSADQPTLNLVLTAAMLCNDGAIEIRDGEVELVGDPTETAILQAAHQAGLDVRAIRQAAPRIDERPFDSERKRMSTSHGALDQRIESLAMLAQDTPIAFVKGAPDGLLDRATQVQSGETTIGLSDEVRRRIADANDAMAMGGMRVLGVGYRTLDDTTDDVEHDLVFLGLIGMIDPPRDEVAEAVATCRSAGIRPIMITGDHPLTAQAIAQDLGISDGGSTMTGSEIEHLTDPELGDAVRTVSVFARVSPEHKLRIVSALRGHGEVVAMTGDGVNDAPALKRADIGVAMGITGTDVSKEAADMVLRDDNFATIVAAVEEGRVIYDNLRRFVSFAVAGNLGKIIVMLGWPIPFLLAGGDTDAAVALLPLQLLWLNLMTDGLLGLAMGFEPAERGVMRRAPHDPSGSLWARGLGSRTMWIGLVIGASALAIGFWYHESGRPEWQTMIFTSLAFLQVFQAIGTRSHTESILTIGLWSNRVMVAIGALVVLLQLAALTTPLKQLLDLRPLGPEDLALCLAMGVGLLAVLELVKAKGRARARVRPASSSA